MDYLTVTVADHTKPGRSVYDLMKNGGSAASGYTVKADVSKVHQLTNSLTVQAGPGNGSKLVFRGGKACANDGSCQARALAAGVIDPVNRGGTDSIDLDTVFVRADTDGAVFNVEFH